MEQRIREYAHVSVMRGCGFGMLAIVTAMMGVANEPALALKFGGLGMLLMAFVLILKAARVDQTRYRSTEVWIMLDEKERPPEALAPFLIAEARKDALLRYAYLSAIIAVVMLAGELALLLLA